MTLLQLQFLIIISKNFNTYSWSIVRSNFSIANSSRVCADNIWVCINRNCSITTGLVVTAHWTQYNKQHCRIWLHYTKRRLQKINCLICLCVLIYWWKHVIINYLCLGHSFSRNKRSHTGAFYGIILSLYIKRKLRDIMTNNIISIQIIKKYCVIVTDVVN